MIDPSRASKAVQRRMTQPRRGLYFDTEITAFSESRRSDLEDPIAAETAGLPGVTIRVREPASSFAPPACHTRGRVGFCLPHGCDGIRLA